MWMVLALAAGLSDPWLELREASARSFETPISLGPSQDDRGEWEGRGEAGRGTTLQILIRDSELQEVEIDLEVPGPDFELDTELDRRSVGLRLRSGRPVMGTYFGLFVEQLDFNDLFPGSDSRAVGIELGGDGSYRFDTSSGRDWSPVLDYSLGASARYSDGSGGIDDLWFLELEGQLGAGVELRGFQATVGAFGSMVFGDVDFSPGSADFFEGSNLAGYGRVAYVGREAPVLVQLQALFGDVRGFFFGFGLRF